MAIPVAQYLRMSTDHQKYSFHNQTTSIKEYADANNFAVMQTYSDSAKSGLMLKNRMALRQLLQDVVGGSAAFKAVLVYDISRWGRFQDTDESAYYEFLCKSSGIPIHYCAEPFSNDLSAVSIIMKTLKRAMACEYSRELGVRVLAGKVNIVKRGYRAGGIAGYGLRRVLVSMDGQRKQVLQARERKGLISDRVILAPGPADEVAHVREMYRMLIDDGFTTLGIAREFNRRGIKDGDADWTHRAIGTILTDPKYAGCNVFGKSSQRMGGRLVMKPRSQWFVMEGAFEPIVDKRTFLYAQQILTNRTINKSNEDLLEILRSILAAEGRLNVRILKKSHAPSPSAYCRRFGSLHNAYALIGYRSARDFSIITTRRNLHILREQLLTEVCAVSSGELTIVKRQKGNFRNLLKINGGEMVSLLLARFLNTHAPRLLWSVEPVHDESEMITLIARLNKNNDGFLDFRLFPKIGRYHQFDITEKSKWFAKGVPVENLSNITSLAKELRRGFQVPRPICFQFPSKTSSIRG